MSELSESEEDYQAKRTKAQKDEQQSQKDEQQAQKDEQQSTQEAECFKEMSALHFLKEMRDCLDFFLQCHSGNADSTTTVDNDSSATGSSASSSVRRLS
jgi:hypothetical protein